VDKVAIESVPLFLAALERVLHIQSVFVCHLQAVVVLVICHLSSRVFILNWLLFWLDDLISVAEGTAHLALHHQDHGLLVVEVLDPLLHGHGAGHGVVQSPLAHYPLIQQHVQRPLLHEKLLVIVVVDRWEDSFELASPFELLFSFLDDLFLLFVGEGLYFDGTITKGGFWDGTSKFEAFLSPAIGGVGVPLIMHCAHHILALVEILLVGSQEEALLPREDVLSPIHLPLLQRDEPCQSKQVCDQGSLNALIQRRVAVKGGRQVHFQQPRVQTVIYQDVEAEQLEAAVPVLAVLLE